MKTKTQFLHAFAFFSISVLFLLPAQRKIFTPPHFFTVSRKQKLWSIIVIGLQRKTDVYGAARKFNRKSSIFFLDNYLNLTISSAKILL